VNKESKAQLSVASFRFFVSVLVTKGYYYKRIAWFTRKRVHGSLHLFHRLCFSENKLRLFERPSQTIAGESIVEKVLAYLAFLCLFQSLQRRDTVRQTLAFIVSANIVNLIQVFSYLFETVTLAFNFLRYLWQRHNSLMPACDVFTMSAHHYFFLFGVFSAQPGRTH